MDPHIEKQKSIQALKQFNLLLNEFNALSKKFDETINQINNQ